jgi:hypothetical protein
VQHRQKDRKLFATVVASMRNEGPFIVEWVTWYRMLGFSRLVVVTNDCQDRSPALLDALAAAGWVQHLRCDIPAGGKVTAAKLAMAKETRAVRRADWVLVCDVDEFLVVHRGAGLLADLLGEGPPRFLGMAINWRVFGNNGVAEFVDVPVHRQFFGAVAADRALNGFVKTIHRQPGWFAALGEHGPRKLNLAAAEGDPALHWVNASGRVLPGWVPDAPYQRRVPPELIDHSVAQINHYMLRSAETYSLKRGTLSPVAAVDRYTDEYWAKADRADEVDLSAVKYAGAFDALFAQAMTLPDVARLHAECCADHRRLIAEKAGLG